MLDPKYQLSAEDTAKFIARLTNHPLVTKAEDITIEDNLVEAIGDAIIRRVQISHRLRPILIKIGLALPWKKSAQEIARDCVCIFPGTRGQALLCIGLARFFRRSL